MPQSNSFLLKFMRLAAGILLFVFAAFGFTSKAHADSILIGITGTPTGPGGLPIVSAPGGTIWLGFSFTLSQGYTNVAITPSFKLIGEQATITTWLTNGLGPSATAANVIGSGTQTLTQSGPDMFLSGLSLGPGSYDVLFSQSNGGVFWSLLSPDTVQLAPGVSLGDQLVCVRGCVDRNFPPGSSWVDTGAAPSSPVMITGMPVPEPSTLALLLAGLAGALLVSFFHKKLHS